MTSPVFSAMLSNTWAEGQNLNSQQPPTIRLPDDNGRALGVILLVLHWKPCPVTAAFPEFLCDIFITADKYNIPSQPLAVFVKMAREMLDQQGMTVGDRYHLLLAAYFIGNNAMFRDASCLLIKGCEQINDLISVSQNSPLSSMVNFSLVDLLHLYGQLNTSYATAFCMFRQRHYDWLAGSLLNCSRRTSEYVKSRLSQLESTLMHSKSLEKQMEGLKGYLKADGFDLWDRAPFNSAPTQEMLGAGLCLKCCRGGPQQRDVCDHDVND